MPDRPALAVLTTARSDFGLLKPVIREAAARFGVELLVAGSHFLASRGATVREVEAEFGRHPGVRLHRLDAMDEDASPAGQVRTLARTQALAADWFAAHRCEALLFLGDRWELWGVTLAAFLFGVPLAHVSGGEVTEGVIDDSVRHAHSKIAALHFAAAEPFAANLSRLGEEDWRIAVVGECGLDLVHAAETATPEEVRQRFGVDLARPTLLVTYHPPTLDRTQSPAAQAAALLQALAGVTDHQIVFTAPGVEAGADAVLAAIQGFVACHPGAVFVEHFGSRAYLAVMKHASLLVGNSSSGVVEAPSFGVPAVNVGDRQKNRLAAASVLHAPCEAGAIAAAIGQGLSPAHQALARRCTNLYDPYRDGRNAQRIVDALHRALQPPWRARLHAKRFDTAVRPDQWNSLLRESP